MDADRPVDASSPVLLIQFARSPVVGRVKTRMQSVLSARQACELHCELVLWTSRILVGAQLGPVHMLVAGDTGHQLFSQCQAMGVAQVQAQQGADLGERMFHALETGLQQYARVLLVGSDCPALDSHYLQAACEALDDADVVLGPAEDGGYVLIGVRDVQARWFEGVQWGGDSVCVDTLARIEETGSRWQLLPQRWDVDRPEDLPRWQALRLSAV